MPLSQNPKPTTGELRTDGLVFRVQSDGVSVALVGWYGDKLSADVVVPARVSSGNDLFEVKALGVPDAEGHCEPLFKGSGATSLSIPAAVKEIAEGALSDCDTLSRVIVSSDNETYSSFDSMLFSKDFSDLLLVPEGKESVAFLPDQTATVPALAFSRCQRLQAVQVGEGCAAFSTRDGILYTKDMKTLVACPPGAGGAVVIPQSVESIGSRAFAGCALSSLTVLGDVKLIAPDAFDDAAKSATVALPEGHDKAAWESAGFSSFSVPAAPGDTSTPDQGNPEAPEGESGSPQSGLSFKVLDDYTLAASWAGGDAPATIEIPATAEVGGASYRVSAIAPAGFSNLAGLESVVLPAGLSSIGEAAFAGCSNLSSVDIPDGVTSIGERAFEATALTEIWLPESVATVGPRAFAACISLSRVVALGTPEVAPDALAECSGISVYCPSGSENSWNPGIPAAGNSVLPYAATLAVEPLAITAGESASILEGGELLAPEPVEASYSYSAKPLSVDADGSVSGKSEGATDVAVALTLDGVELARASRSVEVAPGEAEAQPAMINETATLMPSAYLAGARAAAAPISITAPVAVTFGDGNGYDVASGDTSVTSTGRFVNKSDVPVRLASLSCTDAGASSVLKATGSAPALESQNLFSVAPAADPSKALSFGLASSGVAPADKATFLVEPNSSLECAYRLDLSQAEVLSSVADHGMTVKPLATLVCTFETLGLRLKDVGSGRVYSTAEIKAHAEDISANGEASSWYPVYKGYITNESSYECSTTWGGTVYDVRVIGVLHDEKADGSGKKAGLTFQFENLLDEDCRMKPENVSAGGWGTSELRERMNSGDIWLSVPSDLQQEIEPVKKGFGIERNLTSANVDISNDKLFIASYFELTGSVLDRWSTKAWIANEGEQYEYWQGKVQNLTDGNTSLVKARQSSMDSPNLWWERTIYPDTDTHFLRVITDGNPGNNGSASALGGVCPCFCL